MSGLTLGPGDPNSYDDATLTSTVTKKKKKKKKQQASGFAPAPAGVVAPVEPGPMPNPFTDAEQNWIDNAAFMGMDEELLSVLEPGFMEQQQAKSKQVFTDQGMSDTDFELFQDQLAIDPFTTAANQNIQQFDDLVDQYSNAETLEDIIGISDHDYEMQPLLFDNGKKKKKKQGSDVAAHAAINNDIPLVTEANGDRLIVADLGYGLTDEYINTLTQQGLLPELPDGFNWETHRKDKNGNFIISPEEPRKGQNLTSKLFPAGVTAAISYGVGSPVAGALGLTGMTGGAVAGTTSSTVNQLITNGEINTDQLLTDAILSASVSGITAQAQTSGDVLTGVDSVDAYLKDAGVIGIDPSTGDPGWITGAIDKGVDLFDTVVHGPDLGDGHGVAVDVIDAAGNVVTETPIGLLNNPVVNPIIDTLENVGLFDAIEQVADTIYGTDEPEKTATYDPETDVSQATPTGADVVLVNPEADIAQVQEDNPDVMVLPGLPEKPKKKKKGKGGGDGDGSGDAKSEAVVTGEKEEEVQVVTGWEDPFGDTTAPEPDEVVGPMPDDTVTDPDPDTVVGDPDPDVVVVPDIPTGDVDKPKPDTVLNPNDPAPDTVTGGGTTLGGGGNGGGYGAGEKSEYDLFDYFNIEQPQPAVLRQRAAHLAKLVAEMEITG